MAEVVFYEKPGCINNTRQKKLLFRAGHRVIERNLLQHEWTTLELRRYFGSLPVSQWFNRSAPAIKDGQVNPEQMDEQLALKLMLADPLLIRRPLMQVDNEYMVGFDSDAVHQWIGLPIDAEEKPEGKKVQPDLESCPRK
jgi:nitrogenase-associated protein